MCSKIYGSIVLIAAIVLAVVAANVSIDNIDNVMKIMKFFDIMIPVLAVGALVKYIFCGGKKCKSKCGKCDAKCESKEEKSAA